MVFALLLVPIVAALGYLLHRARIRSLERKFMARVADQMESLTSSRDEADRKAHEIAALDRARSRVLVSMMSDLRTPLMMLKSPLQAAIQLAGTADFDENDVERMLHHANRLQRTVEQVQKVLELELGSADLDYRRKDFITIMERFVTSLRPLAERQGVTVQFSSSLEELPFAFDHARIEQAVYSLVERAIGDMGSGDTLQFLLTSRDASTDGSGRVVLEITDDGRPIDERYLKVLHAQGDWSAFEASVADITALGLAMAHRFVLLHGGELEVDRLGERGTRVRMVLPNRAGHDLLSLDAKGDPVAPTEEEIAPLVTDGEYTGPEKPVKSDDSTSEKKETTVLVVDDHPGTRGYIAYALRRHHHVLEATNGQEALSLIKENAPDLVVSDIMMPVMDGNELCRAIKSDESLNHIPIFLVTANAVPAVKMEGLESGADDYLVKPFDLEEAIMRINNEINSRAEMRKRFSREVVIKPSDITVTSADEAFLNKARDIIEENIEDGNFGVQELAAEMGLSPRQLQRRLRDTVDESPVEFIRSLRLQRAAQLLEGQYGNVSEVAYSVGFTSLSYFAKCFREQFGSSPSEFKADSLRNPISPSVTPTSEDRVETPPPAHKDSPPSGDGSLRSIAGDAALLKVRDR